MMSVRIRWLLGILLLALFAVSSADATVLDAPFINDAVHRAKIIARVHLIDRQPFSNSHSQRAKPCGFIYEASVVDGLKGPSGTFKFFSSVSADFMGFAPDYLVLVYERDVHATNLAVDQIVDAIDGSMLDHLSCVTASPLYVSVPNQNMWAFDTEASKALGGEWLSPPNRPDLSWCMNNGSTGPQGNLVERHVVRNGRSETIMSWSSAKTLIEKTLASGKTPDC